MRTIRKDHLFLQRINQVYIVKVHDMLSPYANEFFRNIRHSIFQERVHLSQIHINTPRGFIAGHDIGKVTICLKVNDIGNVYFHYNVSVLENKNIFIHKKRVTIQLLILFIGYRQVTMQLNKQE